MATPFTDDANTINSPDTAMGGAASSSAAASLPSPTSPSWKSFFRLGGASGRKPSRSKSTLTLDTEFTAASRHTDGNADSDLNSPAMVSKSRSQGPMGGNSNQDVERFSLVTAAVPGTLTPSSSTSFNTSTSNRYSNSTGTLSSEYGQNNVHHPGQSPSRQQNSADANGLAVSPTIPQPARDAGTPRAQPAAPDSLEMNQNGSELGMLPTPSSSAGQERGMRSKSSFKSDKQRVNGQSTLLTPATDALPSPGPTSPKTMSRSGMTKFIRRVASAPNAKNLFSLSKSLKDREGTPGSRTPTSIKGFGFLSPTFGSIGRNGVVPEVPPVPVNGLNGHRVSGQDSLETNSSGSSIRQNHVSTIQSHLNHGPNSTPPPSYHPPSSHPQPTLAHSQSVQNLQPSLLSPTKGVRSTRAHSTATGTFQLRSGKGKSKDPPERIGLLSAPPVPVGTGSDGSGRAPFRRTYSSNSIKVRSVEVDPSSFQKIKLLGRGDVGKVYLVREKKSGRLYAMKGIVLCFCFQESLSYPHNFPSALKKRDD